MTGATARNDASAPAGPIAARVAEIRLRIQKAARAAGRDPASVKLIGVSKRQPIERIAEAFDAGLRDFGENLAQELRTHADALAALGKHPTWHFIGRLQRNKINMILPHTPVVHTLDRLEHAEALASRVPPGNQLDVLVQVNIGREPQKGGVDPALAVMLAQQVAGLEGLRLRGLMTIPPADVDAELYFEEMQALSAELVSTEEGHLATELSMGMSDDFEHAIRFGATFIRVGTAIFGERQTRGGAASEEA